MSVVGHETIVYKGDVLDYRELDEKCYTSGLLCWLRESWKFL